ncbi:MAG: hypothetical protein WCO06_03540, partial [Candidatus Roizmanbacteria bacterium]
MKKRADFIKIVLSVVLIIVSVLILIDTINQRQKFGSTPRAAIVKNRNAGVFCDNNKIIDVQIAENPSCPTLDGAGSNPNINIYTTTYSVTNITRTPIIIRYGANTNFCDSAYGNRGTFCTENGVYPGQLDREIGSEAVATFTLQRANPYNKVCGAFQTDFNITAVNYNGVWRTDCTYGKIGNSQDPADSPGGASVCQTGITCSSTIPTITPVVALFPSAQITAPNTACVGQPILINSLASGNGGSLLRKEILVIKDSAVADTGTKVDGCPIADEVNANGRYFCRLKSETSSTSTTSVQWIPRAAGRYAVINSVFNSGGNSCSGNPYVSYNPPFKTGTYTFISCGPRSVQYIDVSSANDPICSSTIPTSTPIPPPPPTNPPPPPTNPPPPPPTNPPPQVCSGTCTTTAQCATGLVCSSDN